MNLGLRQIINHAKTTQAAIDMNASQDKEEINTQLANTDNQIVKNSKKQEPHSLFKNFFSQETIDGFKNVFGIMSETKAKYIFLVNETTTREQIDQRLTDFRRMYDLRYLKCKDLEESYKNKLKEIEEAYYYIINYNIVN